MAESILDQSPTTPIDPMVRSDAARTEQAAREERLQQQILEQEKRVAEAKARREDVAGTVSEIINRVQSAREERARRDIEAGQQNMNRFFQQVAMREEEQAMNRPGETRQFRFDVRTGRLTAGEPTTASVSAFDAASQLVLEMGVGTAGRAYQVSGGGGKRMTGDDLLQTQPVRGITPELSKAASSVAGGTIALNRFQDRLGAVQGAIEANMGALTGEDGRLDAKKVADFAVNNPDFSPVMAPLLKTYIDVAVLNNNTAIDNAEKVKAEAQKAKSDALAAQYKAMGAQAEALGGNTKFLETLSDPKKFAAQYPEASLLLKGGMSPMDVRYWAEGKATDPAAGEVRRQAWGMVLGKEAFGDDFDPTGFSSEPVAEQTDRLAEVQASVGDVLTRAQNAGEDYVTFAMRELAGDEGDMSPAEYAEYVNQVYGVVTDAVKERVSTQAQAVQEQFSAEVSGRIAGAYSQVAREIERGQDEEWNKLIRSDAFQQEDERKQANMAVKYFVDRASKSAGDYFGTLPEADLVQAAMMTNDSWARDLAMGESRDGDDTYQSLLDIAEYIGSKAVRDGDVKAKEYRAKELELDLTLAKKSLSARDYSAAGPVVQTHEIVPLGDRPVAIPLKYVDNNLAQNIFSSPDNWWVKEVGALAPDGVFTESSSAALAGAKYPPSEVVKRVYGDAAFDIGTRVAKLNADDHVRQVVEAVDLAALPSVTTPPYTQEFYDTKVAPALGIVAKEPAGYTQMEGGGQGVVITRNRHDALVKMLGEVADKYGPAIETDAGDVPSVKELILGEKSNPLLSRMYFEGGSEARQRAIAAALVHQKNLLHGMAVTEVVGGVNLSDKKTTGQSMRQSLDSAYKNVGGGKRDVIDQIAVYGEQARSMGGASLSAGMGVRWFKEYEDFGAAIQIPRLRKEIARHDAMMEKSKELYGDNYDSVAGIDINVIATAASSLSGGRADLAERAVTGTLADARKIVEEYDKVLEAARSERERVRRIIRDQRESIRR